MAYLYETEKALTSRTEDLDRNEIPYKLERGKIE